MAKSQTGLLKQAGFSFLEILLVIVLMATVYAVAAPNLTILESSSIASKIAHFASDIRGAFDTAVLTQKPHRLVFMLETGDYWLESTESTDFALGDHILGRDPTEAEERDMKELFETQFEEYVELTGSEIHDGDHERVIQPISPLLKAKDKLKPTEWKKVENAEWKRRSIGPELIFQDFRAMHHESKQTFQDLGEEARVMLYFLPAGYVEPAVIHIAYRKGKNEIDEIQQPYTIVTNPYEGTADFQSGYEEVELSETRSRKK